jgi:hypothetical protein
LSCVSAGEVNTPPEPVAVPFCVAAQRPANYYGVKLILQGTYKTDNFDNEFIRAASCDGGKFLINVGKHGPSESVARFDAEIKKICISRRSPFVCNISAKVEVVGTLRASRQDPDDSVIDLEEIKQSRFNPER